MATRRKPGPLHRGDWYVSRYCDECGRELRKHQRGGYWCRCGLVYYGRPDVEVGGRPVPVKKREG